jgi:hypothetical protein
VGTVLKQADRILEDEELLDAVYTALGQRHPQSGTRGRKGFPAEVVLRLMVLKHVWNWSYETLEREVRANLVYRSFTRLGDEKMPDAKIMGRWGQALGPQVLKTVHERLVQIARQEKVIVGRKSGTIRPHPGTCRGGRRVLLGGERIGGDTDGREATLDSEPLNKKSEPDTSATEAVVQERTEVAHGIRRPNQLTQTPARIGPLSLSRQ